MAVIENFDKLYIIDQKEGLIYSYDETNGVTLVFNASVLSNELEFNITYRE